MTEIFTELNSPVQYIDTVKGTEIYIKREDLIHPEVSGNKWRKLNYYLQDFRRSGKKTILTFGGAYSNHLAATAALGKITGIPTKALVRGEEVKSNPTLDFCRNCGMEIEAVSRRKYEIKDTPEFRRGIEELLPEVYLIPEGGKGVLGIQGCTEILSAVAPGFDYVCCAGGTGTTMAGLLLTGYQARFLLFPALKGGLFLKNTVEAYLTDYQKHFLTKDHGKVHPASALEIKENYHFGGYGKVKPPLIGFMNAFFEKYSIPLDPVYTGKMMFGIMEMAERGEFGTGTKILAVHTGGLQGIKGMNDRLQGSGDHLQYEI